MDLGRLRLQKLTRSNWFRWAERALMVAVLLYAGHRLWPQVSAWAGVGPIVGRAPDFQVMTLGGEPIGPAELSGKVVVVNFWASWCLPCRLEMPALQRQHERHADEGLVVLGLSSDATPSTARKYLHEHGITYPVAMANDDLRRAFGGITGLPTTFLIDRNGVIRHRVFGFFAPPALSGGVRRLLEES